MASVTITATAEATAIRVPSEIEFGEEAFLPAVELQDLADELVRQYPDSLGHISEVELTVLWKKSGGKRGGKGTFGKTSKRGGLVSAFTTADFIVWLAADHVAEADYTQSQIRALLHHELLHIGYEDPSDEDEDGERKYLLVAHDFEGFAEEVRTYGAWDDLMQVAADAFKQASLFGAEPDGNGHP